MTLLIRNVCILGGEREFPGPMDVFVSNDTISAIGKFPNKGADTVIDGQGAYLAPGFIDIDSASDHYLTLFDDRGQEDFLAQGVTTIIGGLDGASLAPLPYGTLEALRKWGDASRINVNWHTVGEFLESLDRRPLGVNFGTLAGHATIRRVLVGEEIRDLAKNESGVFARMLGEALEEGAFGISADLSAVHTRKVPYAEMAALTAIVAKKDGVYATRVRDAEGSSREDALAETVRLATETGVKTVANHFMPVDGQEDSYRRALAMMNGLPDALAFRFAADPFGQSLLPIYRFLPEWAQNGGIQVMLANIQDEWLLARIRKDIAQIEASSFIIAHAPGSEFLVGKTLGDIRSMYELDDDRDALLALMTALKLKGSILYRNLNAPLARKALAGPRSLVGSHAPSFGTSAKGGWIKPDAATSAFNSFLALAASGSLSPLNLKTAVRKITAEPAALMGIKKRGTVKEGNFADFACFRISNAPLAEMKFTVVNGTVAMEGGVPKGKFRGRALRHAA